MTGVVERRKCWSILLAGLALVSLAACGLEREVELELPPYETQPVLEMYLSPGRPFAALLTRSSGFFDPLEVDNDQFLENLLLDSAEIFVRYGQEEVQLAEFIIQDPTTQLVYNYVSARSVPENYVDSFYLEVRLPDGRSFQAATKLLPPVENDSIRVEYPPDLVAGDDTLARIFTFLTDPDPTQSNQFRRILTYSPADSTVEQDFVFSDDFSDQSTISIGTLYFFAPGDTLYVYTAHVDGVYEEYLNSVQLAQASNGNPFAQPAGILSNLSGDANPVGIFTTYAFVVDTVIVPEP